ncbi:MAG TPA: alcohol dehydrogenase catalytic domain-containing protein [Acidimicrobiia bacterium]|nr:alcohol dehydrogenase catalytic domain-containing protein [Acidimicrobiia bacterium]
MRALVLDRPGQAEVRQVPSPDREGWAVIRVDRVGVCGTDGSIFKGKIPVTYPRVMGHEMAGVVERAGRLGLVEVGTRVVVDPTVTCGYCDMCRDDRANLCRNGGLLGRDLDGVFSELVAVPETLLHPLPDNISTEDAPLLQVLGTCVHGQAATKVLPGDTAVVVGLGVTGLLHLQLLRARGLTQVVGVTRSEGKRELARRLGALEAVHPDEAAAVVDEVSGGRGARLVVESAGYEATFSQAIRLAGAGGTVVFFGTATGGGEGLPYYDLYHKELTLLNPRAALPRDYARAVQLAASGAVQLSPLITHRLPLDKAPTALPQLVADPAALKVIFEVN